MIRGLALQALSMAESGIDRNGVLRRLPDSFIEITSENLTVNIQLNNVSETRKSIVVTLDKTEVDAEHQATVVEFSKFAQLPGFRPGKAPASMILKRYAKEIAGEFKQKVVSKAYKSALDQEKLEVLNIVNLEEGTIEAGLSAAVTVTVAVRPEFTLPDYVGLPTEIAPTEATDAEIEAVIEGVNVRNIATSPLPTAAATAEELRTRADPHPSYIGQSYLMNGPVVLNHDGRTAQATTFRFSPGNPGSATGLIGLGGVARFQMLGGSLAVGDFALVYDASRIGTGGTGWILRSSIPTGTPSPVLFDLADVHAVASVSGFSIDGTLLVSSETASGLFRTPEDAFRRAGSFRFDGFVGVPEPSTVALSSVGALLLIHVVRRRS